MIPHYKNIHNRFKINEFHLNKDSLFQLAYSFIKEGEEFEKEIGLFLLDWLDDNEFVVVNTSGTTGKPKEIKVSKQAMVNSAIATGDYFDLKPGDSVLHCLPSRFIAGKMMLVRAIILGLELDIVSPNSRLEKNFKNYDFTAMVPVQVENNFEKLNQFRKLIIGGAQPSLNLIEKLIQIKGLKAYETYGMTETITHIAAKELNSEYFKVLPEITISTDDRECLVIDAPRITSEKIVTNDIVQIHSKNQFKWLGRIDNVINSGGIKLFPEQIEKKLEKFISDRFFVSSENDERLGNRVVVVIESKPFELDKAIFNNLEKFELPKEVYFVDAFDETKTGKVNRMETLKKVRTVR